MTVDFLYKFDAVSGNLGTPESYSHGAFKISVLIPRFGEP